MADFVAARPLTRQDAKILALSALGGALEFYDFIIFVFFTAVIGRLFFPPEMPDWLRQVQAFGIFAAGYLARPLGGVVMAHFGDRAGRKKMFSLGIFLMAVPTLLIGLLPTYASAGYGAPVLLLLMRVMQGAAIGGEVPGAWVFVAEHVPSRRVGLGCSLLTAGLTGGILIGSLTASAITVNLTAAEVQAWGWRIPFILGGLFGMVVVYLRRWLQETPVFEEIRRHKQLSKTMPLRAVLQEHRGGVALSMTATWMLTAAIVVVILMAPTLLAKLYGVTPAQALTANTLATLCLTVSCILVGLAVDRFGPPRVLAVGCPCLLASVYALYLGTAAAPAWLPLLYAVAGAAVGIIAVVPILMVRAFPAPVRFSGISFSYNLAYAVFGGITPLVVPLATASMPLFSAHYVALACVLAPGLVLVLINRQSRRGGEVFTEAA